MPIGTRLLKLMGGNGKLDIHEDEIGPLGLGFRHSMPTVRGFDNLVACTGEEIAQNAAPVFLIFDDEDEFFRHAAPLPAAARTGNSI
jgi:hypothetical protein